MSVPKNLTKLTNRTPLINKLIQGGEYSNLSTSNCNKYLSKLCFREEFDQAELLFDQMVKYKIQPNVKTYTILINSIVSKIEKQPDTRSSDKLLKQVHKYWHILTKNNIKHSIELKTCLLRSFLAFLPLSQFL